MKFTYKYIALLLITTLLTSCNEEITLDTTFDPQLFIFGNLTNDARKLSITIQESVPVENTSKIPKPVNNAKITLFTENSTGNEIIVTTEFVENNGEYASSQIISPIIGNLYWIQVELENKTIFKSEKEQLKPLVQINNISIVNGFVRATFNDPANDRNFYRLNLFTSDNGDETSTYLLSNDILFDGNSDAFLEEDIGLSGNSARATLMNFNYNTFQFYLNITAQEDAQSDDEGPFQLFAPPPVYLTGNILNTVTKKRVLGNFGVISVSESDEFILK